MDSNSYDERKMFTPIQIFGANIDKLYKTKRVQQHFQKVIEAYQNKLICTYNDFFYALSIVLPKSCLTQFKQVIRKIELPQLGQIPLMNKFFRDMALIDPQSGKKAGEVLCKMNPTTNPQTIIKVAELSLGKKEHNFIEFQKVLEKVCNLKPNVHIVEQYGGDGFCLFTDDEETGKGFIEGKIEEKYDKEVEDDEYGLERKMEAERLLREAFSEEEPNAIVMKKPEIKGIKNEIVKKKKKMSKEEVIDVHLLMESGNVLEDRQDNGLFNKQHQNIEDKQHPDKLLVVSNESNEEKEIIEIDQSSPKQDLQQIELEEVETANQLTLEKIINNVQTKLKSGYRLIENEENKKLLKELAQLIHFDL